MGVITVEVAIILLLIVVNGLLAMSEIAVVSARKVRLQRRAEEGDAGARAALDLAETPGRFLATVQIGITLVGILAGVFGGATIAAHLADRIADIDVLAPYSDTLSVLIVVAVITYLTLVFGELVPKRIGLSFSEDVAARMAPAMAKISRLAGPLVRLLTRSTEGVLRLMRIRTPDAPAVSEDEVRLLIEQGASSGVFEPIEEEIVDQLFRLSDRTVAALITPRTEIVWFDRHESPASLRDKIVESGHSRFPVADGDLDNVVGVMRVKDLMAQSLADGEVTVEASMQAPLFAPESTPALAMLERFRETKSKMALVIDEFGGMIGLLTVNDIVEAILGDLPGHNEPPAVEAVQRDDGSWLLDGMMPADEFQERFTIDNLPKSDDGRYQTVGGMVMALLGHVPSTGDICSVADHSVEVVDMDGRRVDKVLVVPPEASPKAGDKDHFSPAE